MKKEGDDNNITLLQKQVQYFYDNKTPIHITLKEQTATGNSVWYNGVVYEIGSDFFLFDEFREGRIPVFFLQIEKIKIYKTDVEKGADEK